MLYKFHHIYWIFGLELTLGLLQIPLYFQKWMSETYDSVEYDSKNTGLDPSFILTVYLSKLVIMILILCFLLKGAKTPLFFLLHLNMIVPGFEMYIFTHTPTTCRSKDGQNNLDNNACISNFSTMAIRWLICKWFLHWSLSFLKDNFMRLRRFSRNLLRIVFLPQILNIFNSLKAIPVNSYGETSIFLLDIIRAVIDTVKWASVCVFIIGSEKRNMSWMKAGYLISCFTASINLALSNTFELQSKAISVEKFAISCSVIILIVYVLTLIALSRMWKIESQLTSNAWKDVKIFSNKDLDLKDNSKLGSGFFGEVFKGEIGKRIWALNAQFGRVKRQTVAVKFFPNANAKSVMKEIKAEMKILIQTLPEDGHANVVKLVGLFFEKDFTKLGLILEYCENGSLLQKLLQIKNYGKEEKPQIVITHLTTWTIQILDGMKFLASLKIIHGDLAARNVLLDRELCCKITDFGMSQKLYEYQTYVSAGAGVFPWRWGAPECLTNLKLSLKSDIWAFGVLLWEIFSLGSVPYTEKEWTSDFVSFLQEGNRLNKPIQMDLKMYENVLLNCWEWESEMRPSFQELRILF